MTEDKAMTKWCPFARALIWTTGPSLNRYDGDKNLEGETRCIASACMAWRWDWSDPTKQTSCKDGHCGLAGTPRE